MENTKTKEPLDKLESNIGQLKAEAAIAGERYIERNGTDWCDGYLDGLLRAIEVLETANIKKTSGRR
jgi:hypothetical protein